MGALHQSESLAVYNPAVQLVKWLTTQTQRQGLCWHTDGDIISTRLPNATSIQLEVHCEPFGLTWSLLTVYNANGRVLRRVTPDAPSSCNSGLVATIDVLFAAIFSHQVQADFTRQPPSPTPDTVINDNRAAFTTRLAFTH